MKTLKMSTTDSTFIDTCRSLAKLNLEIGPSGNFSVRDNDHIVVTPSGAKFSDISSKNLSRVFLSDPKEYIGLKPTSDLDQHIFIYNNNPDAKAIVHTHAHYIVLAAMLGKDIPVLNTLHADYFNKPIRCLPYKNHRSGLILDLDTAKTERAVLLGKHGGLIILDSPENAVAQVVALNEICKLWCDLLMVYGYENLPETISPEDAALSHGYYSNKYGDNHG